MNPVRNNNGKLENGEILKKDLLNGRISNGVNIDHYLTSYKKIALDTSIFIYHFENNPVYVGLTNEILEAIVSRKINAICSELIFLELMVLPYKNEREDLIDNYEILLTNFPHLSICPVIRPILRGAAKLRAKYQVKTPDAIHLATAIYHGSQVFIGNDKDLSKIKEIKILNLDQFIKNGE